MMIRRFSLYCVVTAILVSISALWRRLPIDDAYITYRYAQQILLGNGFVYNPGEWILGTTTPLWGWILAVAGMCGAGLETASIVGGCVATICTIAIFFTKYPAAYSPQKLLPWIMVVALYYPLSVVTFSGMETALYTLVVGVGLFFFSNGRLLPGVVLALFATLLRPDGVLVAGAGILSMFTLERRKALRALLLFSALLLPVLLLSYMYYGGIVPHSVGAKRVLYPAAIGINILYFFEALSQTPIDALLLCIGGAGVCLSASHRSLRTYAVWGLMYSVGLVCSGVKPIFFWYFGPLWMLLLTVGVYGVLIRFGSTIGKLSNRWCIVSVLVLLVLGGADTWSRASGLDPVEVRENAYREVVVHYSSKITPNARVLVGETGIIGAGMLHARIVDSSGINSRQISSILRSIRERIGVGKDLNRESEWLKEVITATEPDWIIGARDRMQLSIAESQIWFKERYVLRDVFAPQELGGVGVYARVTDSKG